MYEVEVEPVSTCVAKVEPPSVEYCTAYPVIELPPFDAGAVQEIVARLEPVAAETLVGAPGVVVGVTALEAVEYEPVPAELTAATRKV